MERDDDFSRDWFRFIGEVQTSHRRHYSDVRVGVDERGASVWFGDLMGSTFTLAATSADPAVIRFFLRCYIAWKETMDLRLMGESSRRKMHREEEQKRRPRSRFCPDCNALGEVFVMDRAVPCQRCDGTGYLR